MDDTLTPAPDLGLNGPDYFLHADDEAQLQTALATMGLWTQPIAKKDGIVGGYRTGGFIDDGGQFALDLVGPVWTRQKRADGTVITAPDAVGNDVPVMVLVPGFHANLRWLSETPLSPEMRALVLARPKTPSRVFA